MLSPLLEPVQFAAAGRRRAAQYSKLYPLSPLAREAAGRLATDGYIVLRDVLDRTLVDRLRAEVDHAVAAGRLVPALVRQAHAEQPVDPEDQQRLCRLAALGESELGRRESMVYVVNPLLTCPTALPLLFSDPVLDIATSYYGCPAALISPKIVRSYRNGLPESSVHRFHCDYQRVRFLKFFIYLSDVPTEQEGPFCFVAGSHHRKPRAWRQHPLEWSAAEMTGYYGDAAIRPLTGYRGDLIAADTRGFHRGIKLRAGQRSMLKVSTGLRAWQGTPARLAPDQADSLSPKQRAAADFLVV